MTTSPEHVAVIGGGIFGASTAVQLLRRGVRVTLVTDGPLAGGASGRSLAWLNSAGQRSRAYHDLRVAGIDRWRTWAFRNPDRATAIRFSGGLTWAADGESFADRFAHERALGYDSVWVSPGRASELVAGVDASAIAAEGAIFNAGEGWVNLPTVIEVMAEEILARGGEIITGSGRSRAVIEAGRAVGIVTGDGSRIDADAVVVATGPDVPAQLEDLGVPIADESPAAFVAFTRPVESPLEAVLNTPRVAIRRTVDGGLALDSAWSEEAIVVRDDGSLEVGDDLVEGLFAEARRVLSDVPALELDRVGAGYKPIPGGGEPVIGAVDAVPGLFVGFSHSGATLGLLVGELLAERIIDGLTSPLLETFSPSRFIATS